MSKISVYTTCTNAIRDEFFPLEGIRSALNFADEVIVVDGGSTDNTIDKIRGLNTNIVKIYNNEWLDSLGKNMYAINKSMALGHCSGDWCVLMDSDEVFHEEDADRIRGIAEHVSKDILAIEFNTIHFYKTYRNIINGCPDWKDLYDRKIYMVRNNRFMHHGALGEEADAHVDLHGKPIPRDKIITANIRVFHYGHVRTKETYIKKKNAIEKRHNLEWEDLTVDAFEWLPDNKLKPYYGSHPSVMYDRISAGLDYRKIMELYQ